MRLYSHSKLVRSIFQLPKAHEKRLKYVNIIILVNRDKRAAMDDK